MTFTPGLSSVRDLFAKLQRDADLLDDEVTNECSALQRVRKP